MHRAGDVDTGGIGLDGPQLGGRLHQEAMLVIAHVQLLGKLLDAGRWAHGGGQHHQVGFHRNRHSGERVRAAHNQLPAFLGDLGNPAAIVVRTVLLDGAPHEFVIALAAGTDIHVKHVRLAVMHLVLVEHGVLGGVHAANLGAVSDALRIVARADAGDEYDVLGNRAVRRSLQHAVGRPGGGYQALELERVDYIPILAVSIFTVAAERLLVLLFRNTVERVAGGNYDGANAFFGELLLVVEIDGPGLALFGADFATLAALQPCAVDFVNHGTRRHRLRKWNVDCRAIAHAVIEFAGILLDRATRPAVAAACALADVHVAGLLPDLNLEVADVALDGLYLGIAVKLDAGMLADLHHARRQDALRAVQGGKRLG